MSAGILLFKKWAGLVLVTLCLFTGCVTEVSPVTGRTRLYGYSWEKERQIGEQADRQIIQQLGLYEDEALQHYVDTVAQRVLENSDMRGADVPEKYQQTPFVFRVLDSPVVNAFALPGGYIYVTRGLLSHLENEAQLAVVLAHEIAHVAARHASQQALKATTGQLGIVAGAIVGAQIFENPAIAQNVLQIGGQVFELLLLKYSRNHERESDELGVKYATAAGYQAGEAAGFFESLKRIQGQQGISLPDWQSTHPDPGEREKKIRVMAEEMGAAGQKVNRDAFLERIEGVVIGDNPREGYEEKGVFYHPQLRFLFSPPSGWRLQNERAVVLMVPENGSALMALKLTQAASAEAAAKAFAASQGIQVVEARQVSVNGLKAVRVIARAAGKQGTLGIQDYFIEHGGQTYSLVGVSSSNNFIRFQKLFEETANTFMELTDKDKINIEPVRIQVVTADRDAALQEFIPANLRFGLTPADVAIMNQLHLDQVVKQGSKLKLPAAR